jgi:CDGSH-type Zn-finger protein
MSDNNNENRPIIIPTKDGPYMVKNLDKFVSSRGKFFDKQPQMFLCRCGKSGTKPFCNGTHARIGFKGDKLEGRVPDKWDDYQGKDITIHDNRGVCSHAGACTNNLPNIFIMSKEPWIEPDNATSKEIADVIKTCPSGALRYTIEGKPSKDFYEGDEKREPMIRIWPDGPYQVVGYVKFEDPGTNTKPATEEHYRLCRCGASKNKPFCDGTHWYVGFKDEKN